jgi:hypothetical protein
MIEIKPNIQHQSNCPYCKKSIKPVNVRFLGMHVLVESKCLNCHIELLESLAFGHFIHQIFKLI